MDGKSITRERRQGIAILANALKVLVVEDNEAMQGVFGECLQGLGARVTVASTAEEALGLARTKAFDLYITDGCYPLMFGTPIAEQAGFYFYVRLKVIRPDARVMMISGRDDFEAAARKAGMDFLRKADFAAKHKDVLSKYFN